MNALKDKTGATEVLIRDVTPQPLEVNTDAGAYSKTGWLIVVIGVLGFLIWAAFAPLDKGVPLPGTVASEGSRKLVQNLAGGTVDKIYVKDGDLVQAGQVLVRMNDIAAKAALDSSRSQYMAFRASEARLLAERDGLKTLTFPAALKPYKDDPRLAPTVALQAQLLSSRQGSLQSEIGGIDESIAGLKLQIQGLEASRDSKQAQLGFLKEELAGLRDLAKDGYVARNRLLDQERTYAQLAGSISEDIGNIGRSQRQVLELNLRRNQRLQDYQKEVRTQLADVQKESETIANRIDSQTFDLANVEVKAPVKGIVVGLSVFTQGGVVGAGTKLMEISPSGDALIVEGQLPTNLIDKVHPGLKVELIFSAFDKNHTPHIPGEIIQVSADRSIDEHTGQPYYKVRAKVDADGHKIIARDKLDVQPGMPVEMFVKTGERTMLNYLLKPVFDRAKTSMSED